MKKILVILFFISCRCEAQITIVEYVSGFNTGGIGSIASHTYEAGKIYIVFAGTTNSTTPATVSLSGGATTWNEIANIVSDGSTMRIQAFRYAPGSNETTTVTVNYTGSQDGGFVIGYAVTGADVTGTNGSNAIVQSATDAIDANANPTITMTAISSNRNAVVCGFINTLNPFGGTAETDWTETEDNGYNTPTTGGYGMYRLSTTDNTPTVTAASSNWAGIAIEIKSPFRRIIITN